MANHQALHAALADFATRLTERYDMDEVLHDVSDRAVQVLGLDGGAGLTIGPNPAAGEMSFVTATNEATTYVERRQDELRAGVCFEAAKRGGPLLVSSLEATNLWPQFTEECLSVGFRSAAGIPMVSEGEMIGVLNCYRREVGAWTNEDAEAAQLLARVATTYLVNASQLGEARKLAGQLQLALDSRVVIEQSKGVLAERLQCTPDVAFDLLRSYARSNRRPLRNVAEQVIGGQLDIGRQN
jgi:GAF domain-containing protein